MRVGGQGLMNAKVKTRCAHVLRVLYLARTRLLLQ